MAKLVEILARELKEWPEDCEAIEQDRRGSCLYKVNGPAIATYVEAVADDADTAKVTRAQWQAERDRQKGGEWKRHRGMKQPVPDGVIVEVKLRCGDIQKSDAKDFIWTYGYCDIDANIMKYRVISQQQAEAAEVNKFCMGEKCNATSDNILHSSECEAEHEASYNGAWDQIETPFKWRDEVTELNAYIEKYTRERDALIERLASEGFALIPPVVTAKPDVLPFEEWQVGDVVEVTNVAEFANEKIKVGDQLPIIRVDKSDDTVSVGIGTWSDTGSYKFIRRP